MLKILQTIQPCKGTQTIYRESDTQTIPWEPPCRIISSETPELLHLSSFKWGKGLPVGKHEVEIIKRLRKKRAWDSYIESICRSSNCDIKLLKRIISDIESDDNNFHEKEIDEINSLRLQKAKEILEEERKNIIYRINYRSEKILNEELAKSRDRIEKIKLKRDRALRMSMSQLKNNLKQKKSVLDKFIDKGSTLQSSSALYGPNKRIIKLVPEAELIPLPDIREVRDILSTTKTVIPQKGLDKYFTNKSQNSFTTHNCTYDNQSWTLKKMRKLHDCLLERLKTSRTSSQSTITKMESPSSTTKKVGAEDETMYQSAVLLETLVKGQTVQTIMQDKQTQRGQMTDELLSTFGLLPEDIGEKENTQRIKMEKLRNYWIAKKKMDLVMSVVNEIEADTKGTMLDFSYKELIRLQEERRIHSMAITSEMERFKREAAESGRRQYELKRRLQNDEILGTIIKVTDMSIDEYLMDLFGFEIDDISNSEALEKSKDFIIKLDSIIRKTETLEELIDNKEISDLLEQVSSLKNLPKRKVKRRQIIEEAIFNNDDNDTCNNFEETSNTALNALKTTTIEVPELTVIEISESTSLEIPQLQDEIIEVKDEITEEPKEALQHEYPSLIVDNNVIIEESLLNLKECPDSLPKFTDSIHYCPDNETKEIKNEKENESEIDIENNIPTIEEDIENVVDEIKSKSSISDIENIFTIEENTDRKLNEENDNSKSDIENIVTIEEYTERKLNEVNDNSKSDIENTEKGGNNERESVKDLTDDQYKIEELEKSENINIVNETESESVAKSSYAAVTENITTDDSDPERSSVEYSDFEIETDKSEGYQ